MRLGVLRVAVRRVAGTLACILVQAVCAAGPAWANASDDAQATYWQALQALKQEQWVQAELLLERTLLLQPENAQAIVDLAMLLAVRDRPGAARALLTALIEDSRTPPGQLSRLTMLRSSIGTSTGAVPESLSAVTANATAASGATGTPAAPGAPRPASPSWTASAPVTTEWLVGFGSNPLISPSTDRLTLTLPDGDYQFPLEQRRRSAGYGSFMLQGSAWRGVEWLAQAQKTDSSGLDPAIRLQAQALLGQGLGVGIQAQGRLQQYTDGSQRRQLGLEVQRGPWAVVAGLYDEVARSRTGWTGRAGVQATLGGKSLATVAAWLETESNRREGAPGYGGMGFAFAWKPASRSAIQAQALWQRDRAGYNPLLANNAHRWLVSTHAFGEQEISRTSRSVWLVRAYTTRRLSNIGLFEGGDKGIQVIWRNTW